MLKCRHGLKSCFGLQPGLSDQGYLFICSLNVEHGFDVRLGEPQVCDRPDPATELTFSLPVVISLHHYHVEMCFKGFVDILEERVRTLDEMPEPFVRSSVALDGVEEQGVDSSILKFCKDESA